ncbi:tail fiber protein [Bacteroides phage BF766P4]|nr:tail fiber protein [Bacteroides phage BF766P4]
MGNTKNPERQALIYITAQESGHPYIEILNGVKTKSLSGTNRTRLGDLSNIQDSAFPEGQQPSGSGLYCDNAFLRGIFLLRNGKSVEDEVNQAKQDAANAATEAERAQQTAQEAKDRLNKWADDGFISPTEKPALIDEGKRIQAEFLQIKNNADKYGVSVTEYTKAYEDYLNELRYHSAQQPEDIAVRPELAQSQTAYYDKRNGALNEIATASKEYVDNADKQLKEYLDTEITAIPGKIELAVRSLKVSTGNLLKKSNIVQEQLNYQFGGYSYNVFPILGKDYTLTLCYTLGANNTEIQAYSDNGYNHIQRFTTKGNAVIESKKVTFTAFNDRNGMRFYQLPNGTYGSKVHWAVLSEGNVGTTNWLPSTNEGLVGGQNLVLNSGMCISSYAMFGMSKSYYELRGKTVCISFDYEYSNLVLGGNNCFGLETEVPTGGGTDYFGAWIYLDSTSPTSASGRRTYVYNLRNDIEDSGLKHIQAHVQVGAGTIVKMCNFQVEIGYTPTEWKPAPEDTLNESIKYTDTQILAVDGKIELTVKTKVENLGIGANNLFSYTSSDLNNLGDSYVAVEKINDIHGFKVTGENHGRNIVRIPNIIPPIPGKYTVSGWIKGSQSTTPGITIDVCDSDSYRVLATPDNNWSYFKHTFDVSKNTEDQKDIYNFVDLGDISWAYIWVKDFKVESGEIATAWSPNIQDGVYRSAEYTNQQISVVEGKITTTVEKLTEVDGKVTGLASRVDQTEKSITSVVGDINVLNSTTNRHVTKQIDLTGWDNNKFFPLSIGLPAGHKSKVEINRPLNAAYGKPSYGTHDAGFSMNLSFEMSGSGWGASAVVTNIFDYVRLWSSGKIIVDLGQITESSNCVMGIRGGSKYDVTVYDTTNQNTINVYQADYTAPQGQVFPVRTDGIEPVRTYGYYSEIKQTQESISATVAKVDDQGRRLSAAELTLSADHAKLSVVETTANNANSTASAASGKADAVDGRVTATQNGLVETGINITSRKIVLKSDNVLFQNNAGQQTAAINANGKLTANAIEVGEVVAGGFAAQRITTGNLTVTDGAVIGGMTITGGVLTGKNINIQDGAKIGNFTIVSGIFSAQNTPAGIQMTLSNNAATFDSSGVRVEHNSGGYALTTTGNGRVFLTGSNFWVQCKDVDFMGVQTWKAPGVFYACTILGSGAIGATWGNPDFHITRVVLNSTGRYTVYTSGGQVGNYFVMVQGYDPSLWLSTTVEPYSAGQFTYKVFDVNTGLKNAAVIIYFCGMVS